ncbi:Protein NATD1 N-acetyltransferase domain-containing protein 1 [Channa argus]|uniref:Protein NATD1 n=1 Tax=Channa argus TaxID=215402 RepID=A0A6G1QBY1_CHAAH|nr:Protein NATD1 N-acetyltransferase domain-containing protein 1 [Channa argus]
MALNMFPRFTALSVRLKSYSAACSTLSSSFRLKVEHDRHNQRFTVTPSSGAGPRECAVLQYRFTGEKEVDLMSTYVPEAFRSQGVAALLSQAALDFLVEENLKAHVSCWYIKKYIDDHSLQQYKDLIIT